MCDTAYLKKGNFYWIKFIVCSDMLGICVKYMIVLAVLKTLRNTFLTNVSLVIMELYLRVYNYYDVQQIEEFVAFRGTCEIASFIEQCDTTLYKSENLAILKVMCITERAQRYLFDNRSDKS